MSKPNDLERFTPADLAQIFRYDPETGVVRRHLARGGQPCGVAVGRKGSDGYLRVGVNKRSTLVHRIAWCLHYGRWPAGVLDHINGNTGDNRITNLRDVSQQTNLLNQHVRRPSAVGVPGVSVLPSGRYRARLNLTLSGKRKLIHLGVFETAEDAGRAYERAKDQAMRGAGCF